jgi:LPXTG-site transpeptidase (sortase) family protein
LLSSAAFGEPGNLVVAGHRTSSFQPLHGISQGDTIQLEWFDSRGGFHQRIYGVALIRVTDPKDTALLAPTEGDALTLVTCYPFGLGPNSPKRFMVRALPADASRNAAAFINKRLRPEPTERQLVTAIKKDVQKGSPSGRGGMFSRDPALRFLFAIVVPHERYGDFSAG